MHVKVRMYIVLFAPLASGIKYDQNAKKKGRKGRKKKSQSLYRDYLLLQTSRLVIVIDNTKWLIETLKRPWNINPFAHEMFLKYLEK